MQPISGFCSVKDGIPERTSPIADNLLLQAHTCVLGGRDRLPRLTWNDAFTPRGLKIVLKTQFSEFLIPANCFNISNLADECVN
jgi:hypothetical protein